MTAPTPTPPSSRRTTAVVVAVAAVVGAVAIVLIVRGGTPAPAPTPGSTTTAAPATQGRCGTAATSLVPADYYARADVSKLPVLHNGWVSRIVAVDAAANLSSNRRHDQLWPLASNQDPTAPRSQFAPEGFPVNTVHAGYPTVNWQTGVLPISPSFLGGRVGNFQSYGAFADTGAYPSPANLKIEGYPNPPAYDDLLLTVDADTCTAYEQIGVHSVLPADANGNQLPPPYVAEGGMRWDLAHPRPTAKAGQPQGITGARVPITPLILRFDEVARAAAGGAPVSHAVHWYGIFCRGGTRTLGQAFVWPARATDCHDSRDADAPPYGAWFRLRADYPTAGLTPQAVAIVRALQVHGLILGDGGGQGYAMESAPCPHGGDDPTQCWQQGTIDQLKAIDLHDLEAVDTTSLRADPAATPDSPSYWTIRSGS